MRLLAFALAALLCACTSASAAPTLGAIHGNSIVHITTLPVGPTLARLQSIGVHRDVPPAFVFLTIGPGQCFGNDYGGTADEILRIILTAVDSPGYVLPDGYVVIRAPLVNNEQFQAACRALVPQ